MLFQRLCTGYGYSSVEYASGGAAEYEPVVAASMRGSVHESSEDRLHLKMRQRRGLQDCWSFLFTIAYIIKLPLRRSGHGRAALFVRHPADDVLVDGPE